jgi:hypothetical protein
MKDANEKHFNIFRNAPWLLPLMFDGQQCTRLNLYKRWKEPGLIRASENGKNQAFQKSQMEFKSDPLLAPRLPKCMEQCACSLKYAPGPYIWLSVCKFCSFSLCMLLELASFTCTWCLTLVPSLHMLENCPHSFIQQISVECLPQARHYIRCTLCVNLYYGMFL